METGRMLLRGRIALSLFGEHMDEHSVLSALRLPDHPHQRPGIMAVHRAKIGDAHILEHHAGDHKLL